MSVKIKQKKCYLIGKQTDVGFVSKGSAFMTEKSAYMLAGFYNRKEGLSKENGYTVQEIQLSYHEWVEN